MKDILKNENIQCKKIYLVDDNYTGEITLKKAMKMAKKENKDVIVVSQTGLIPVCKILNESKYIYEMTKKEKKIKRENRKISEKKIYIGPNISNNDMLIKVNQIKKMRNKNHKIKIIMQLKGRERNNVEFYKNKFLLFMNMLDIYDYTIDYYNNNLITLIN